METIVNAQSWYKKYVNKYNVHKHVLPKSRIWIPFKLYMYCQQLNKCQQNNILTSEHDITAKSSQHFRTMVAGSLWVLHDLLVRSKHQIICYARPVSESEWKNGTSDSERDFSREQATKHTSESKWAKFKTAHDFLCSTACNAHVLAIVRLLSVCPSVTLCDCIKTLLTKIFIVGCHKLARNLTGIIPIECIK